MGMFTSIMHEGRELQIKHGWDTCSTYKVGDRIHWTPDPRYPGDHIDGVYEACCYPDPYSPAVVIKDCVIVAVEPPDSDFHELALKYGITKPDRSLWPEEQWAAAAAHDAAEEAKYQEYQKVHGGGPIGYFMRLKLQEKSFMDRTVPFVKEHK